MEIISSPVTVSRDFVQEIGDVGGLVLVGWIAGAGIN